MGATSERQREGALADRDLAILRFEGREWRHSGVKDEAIRLEFDVSVARYYQLLNALIDSPAAARYDPMLVKRLKRLRTGRTRVGVATDS